MSFVCRSCVVRVSFVCRCVSLCVVRVSFVCRSCVVRVSFVCRSCVVRDLRAVIDTQNQFQKIKDDFARFWINLEKAILHYVFVEMLTVWAF